MLSIKDIENIQYFNDFIAINEIKQGYSERKKYKIITKNKTYFLKIHHYKLSKKEVMREKNLYEIYQKLSIPIVPLLDLIEYKNQTIFIYPFFEGISLKEANLSIAEYYLYGVKVGKEVIKLKNISTNPKLFSKMNLSNYFTANLRRIREFWENNDYQAKILQIFSKEELKSLLVVYKSLLDLMKTQKFSLNHNDIKIANIMLDKQRNHYLVDIDPIDLTPVGFNVYYSIHTFLLPYFKENQKSFLRGFIKTIDPNREIVKQLQYFLIADMINELEDLLNQHFNEMQQNKEYMKNMLFNKKGFLEKVIYGK